MLRDAACAVLLRASFRADRWTLWKGGTLSVVFAGLSQLGLRWSTLVPTNARNGAYRSERGGRQKRLEAEIGDRQAEKVSIACFKSVIL